MKLKNLLCSLVIAGFTFGLFLQPAAAQCGLLPSFLENLICDDNPVDVLVNRVQVGFLIAFTVVIIIAVAYVIYASVKFIRAKGDAGQIEEGTKSMQGIFYGVGALFVGVIGIAVVLIFFNTTVNNTLICVSAPDSYGCYACQNADGEENLQAICDYCSDETDASLGSFDCNDQPGNNETNSEILESLEDVNTSNF